MFDAIEQKVLLSTLDKRCTWLKKTIEQGELSPKALTEHKATYKALVNAAKKIEHITPLKKIPPPSVSAPPKKQKKHSVDLADAYILIAEDDPDSAILLEGIVNDIGIKHISIARDGREAVSALKNASPSFDIVLCDWDMPELSGLEVRRQVRNLAKLQDTHFIMVTAVSESARIKEAITEGITDYVIKPVDASIIEKKIKAALAGNIVSPAQKDDQNTTEQTPNDTSSL